MLCLLLLRKPQSGKASFLIFLVTLYVWGTVPGLLEPLSPCTLGSPNLHSLSSLSSVLLSQNCQFYHIPRPSTNRRDRWYTFKVYKLKHPGSSPPTESNPQPDYTSELCLSITSWRELEMHIHLVIIFPKQNSIDLKLKIFHESLGSSLLPLLPQY